MDPVITPSTSSPLRLSVPGRTGGRAAFRQSRLRARMYQDPLFASHCRNLQPDPAALEGAQSCWFGVGLRGRMVSQGLPLDVLLMIFAQETVRRTLDLEHSQIVIADTNAHAMGDDPVQVHRARQQVKQILTTVCDQFRFPVAIFWASQMIGARKIEEEARKIGTANPYVNLQLAQMEHMRQSGATIKIGWSVPGWQNDERQFDELYRGHYRKPLGFVYTHGGRGLSRTHARCCPYVCERPEDRLLLDPHEVIETKLHQHAHNADLVQGYRRLIGRLARAHRNLVAPDRGGDPIHRIQTIIDRLPRMQIDRVSDLG